MNTALPFAASLSTPSKFNPASTIPGDKWELYRIHITKPGTKVDFDEFSFGFNPKDAIRRFLNSNNSFESYDLTAMLYKQKLIC